MRVDLSGLENEVIKARKHQMSALNTCNNDGAFALQDSTPSDARDVAVLADSLDVSAVECPAKDGFLAAQYTEADYRKFIEMADYSFTLRSKEAASGESNSELVGFLVAYGSEKIYESDEFNSYVIRNICERFVTIRQVFVSPKKEYRRRGLGSLLYRELFRRILRDHHSQSENAIRYETSDESMKETSCACARPVFADIVMTPENNPSRDFHIHMGFDIVGEMTRQKDSRRILVFRKNIQCA